MNRNRSALGHIFAACLAMAATVTVAAIAKPQESPKGTTLALTAALFLGAAHIVAAARAMDGVD